MGKQATKVAQHCVGRTVISVPERFFISNIATGQFKTVEMGERGPAIEVVARADQVARDKFAAEIAQLRNELEQRTSGEIDVIRLEKALDEQTTMFRVQQVDDAYKSEIVLLRNGNVIRASLESFHNDYLAEEERLINFVKSIKLADEVSAATRTQGFCLGAVVITAELRKEAGNFTFDDKRGLILELDLDTYAKDAKVPLLARMSGPDSLMTKFDVRPNILRSGERSVAGMKAQEWLGWVETGDKQETYIFAVETMRPVPGKETPKLHLSLETADRLPNGKTVGKVLPDDEAVQLWDVIVDSIRPASSG